MYSQAMYMTKCSTSFVATKMTKIKKTENKK